MGGTIQNSSATTATLTEVNNSSSTFGGAIDGNLNFNKYGNSTCFWRARIPTRERRSWAAAR
jgi:hypothetical protein